MKTKHEQVKEETVGMGQRICELLPVIAALGLGALFLFSPRPFTDTFNTEVERWVEYGMSDPMAQLSMTALTCVMAAFIVYFPTKMAGECLVRISKSKSDL